MNFILKRRIFLVIAAFLNLTAVFAARSKILGVARFSKEKSLVLYTSQGKSGLKSFVGEKSEDIFIPGLEDINAKSCVPLEYQDFNGLAFVGERDGWSCMYWIYEDKGNFFLKKLYVFDFEVSKIEQSFRDEDFFVLFCSGEKVLYKLTLNLKTGKFFACKQLFNALDPCVKNEIELSAADDFNEEKPWESDSYWQEDSDVVSEDYIKKMTDEDYIPENEMKFYTELVMGKFYCLVSCKNSGKNNLFFIYSNNSYDSMFLINNDFKPHTAFSCGLTSDNNFYFAMNELDGEKYNSKLMILNKKKFNPKLAETKKAENENKLMFCPDIFESKFDSPFEIQILKYDEFVLGDESGGSGVQSENPRGQNENPEDKLVYVYGKKFNNDKTRSDIYVLFVKSGNENFKEYTGIDEINIYRNFYDSFDFVVLDEETCHWTYFCLWKDNETGKIIEYKNYFYDFLEEYEYMGSFVGSTFNDSFTLYFSNPERSMGLSFCCEYGGIERKSKFTFENMPREISHGGGYGSERFKNKITCFDEPLYFSLENQILRLDEGGKAAELIPYRNLVQSSFRWNKSVIACSDDEKIFCIEVEAY